MTGKIAVIMGSQSDYEIMQSCISILDEFKANFEVKIVSAHRTPERLYEFAKNAQKNKIKVIIAGAGGSAHLPGMTAALTQIPVIGVPIKSKFLDGLDSLLSIVQMPAGIPVATVAVGKAGAKNAALLAIAILALQDDEISKKLTNYRQKQTDKVDINPQ
jgi:5-(carboxyamino)imidazole ribonucleotide mutase